MNRHRRSFKTTRWENEERLSEQLRNAIESNGDVKATLRRMDQNIQGPAHAMEALKSKDLEDGHNLLMFAASLGRSMPFNSLVEAVKERLGPRTLVRHLRESDIDGAPMLFQAASSSSVKCLRHVSKVIEETLGSSELREQLKAKDLKGRTIIFHAATTKNVKVFYEIITMLAKEDPHGSWIAVEGNGGARETAFEEEGEIAPRIASKHRTVSMAIADKTVLVDHKGMNLLHHASRYGSARVLELVVKGARQYGSSFLGGYLHSVDGKGRTPLMCLLRQETKQRDSEMSEKLKLLLHNMAATSTRTSEYGDFHSSSEDMLVYMTNSPSTKYDGTVLTNAAHGGPEQFELARETICSLVRNRCHGDGGIDLDIALGLEEGGPQWAESEGPDLSEKRKKRYGILLEEAASGGHVSVLEDVVSAIKTGHLQKHVASSEDYFLSQDNVQNERVKDAIERASATDSGTLFTVAISSRRIEAVHFVNQLIKLHASSHLEVFELLSACKTNMRNLTFAASMSTLLSNEDAILEVFRAVYSAIKEAADKAFGDKATDHLRDMFFPGNGEGGNAVRTPLSGAMFCSNKYIFGEVYKTYKALGGRNWTVRQMLDQIPTGINFGEKDEKLYSKASKGCVANISPTMLFTLMKAIRQSKPASDGVVKRQERFSASQRMQRIAQLAAERGAFGLFRVLANDNDPVLLDTIPSLLERVVDYEDNIFDIVMLTVKCARNPFATSAVASRYIDKAEASLPMHKKGLRRLGEEIDTLVQEVLNALPNTVKGVGVDFAIHEPTLLKLRMDPTCPREHDRLAAELGFMVVQWILEPSTMDERLLRAPRNGKGGGDSEGPEIIDPLQYALERGSKALPFINAPLVLDYINLKFSRATPAWNMTNPFATNVSKIYYTYHRADPQSSPGEREEAIRADILLRFLQGWDEGDDTGNPKPHQARIPHYTLLPGLQFNLAGIIGNPSAFYEVPSMRFAYEFLSYMVLIALFCSCVFIDDPTHIPVDEIVFYFFIFGILWRETLEFSEFLPTRRNITSDEEMEKRAWKSSHHAASAVPRYLFNDTWNFFDTSTIVCSLVAFVFRIIALHKTYEHERGDSVPIEDQSAFFVAKVVLAASTPLLFARVLSLSQIDGTLGPMTQIIWTMLSHLVHFSFFLLVLITSFALTFYGLYSSCVNGNESYGTLADATLSMFKAMLGDFEFDDLRPSTDCNHPDFAEDAATALLVVYLVLVTVLFLNLLIAILSTAHAEVYANAEQEFRLARAKLIQQSCRDVLQERQPPPINLVMSIIGFILNVVGRAGNILSTSRQRRNHSKWRDATLGAMHRIIFALVMGSVAMVMFIVLWVASLPWIAWTIFRLRFLRSGAWRMRPCNPLWSAIVPIVGWMLAFAFSIFCFAICTLGSIVLWFCGVWSIWQWWRAEMIDNGRDGSRHRMVQDIIFKRHNGSEPELGHFRVDHLLKTSTGLNIDDLVLHAKRRENGKQLSNRNQDHDEGKDLDKLPPLSRVLRKARSRSAASVRGPSM